MTKSAKQDTTKAPAEPAETESAATQAEAATQAVTGPGEPEPKETGPQETRPDETGAPGEGPDKAEDAKPDLDETKRKFREALERKHQARSEGQGSGGRDGGKINGAHGPAANRRSFRRKSG